MFSRFNTINIDQYAILSTCEKSMVGMVGVTQMPWGRTFQGAMGRV